MAKATTKTTATKTATAAGLPGAGRENCWMFCHCWSLLKAPTTWLVALAAFITLSVVEFVMHGVVLMPAYQATPNLWRPVDEMNPALFYLSYALQALVFAILVQLATRTLGVVEGARVGLMIYGLMAISLIIVANTQPIPGAIIGGWAIGYVVSGLLMGTVAQLVRQARATR